MVSRPQILTPAGPDPRKRASFSMAAQRYFAEHAIDPQVAAACGVRETAGELTFPYESVDGRAFTRTRPLGPGKSDTHQPFGEPLTLWWPAGRPSLRGATVIVCEGEGDALAALTALHGAGGDLSVAVCAVPGASFPAERLLEQLAAANPGFCMVLADGDQAGRGLSERVQRAATGSALNVRIAAGEMPDGKDLSDMLVALPADGPTGGQWLTSLIADYEIWYDEQVAAASNREPVERRVTDRANAQRLADATLAVARFLHDDKRWRVWDGVRWAVDTDERMTRLAIRTAQRIYEEAEHAAGEDRKKLLRHAQKSESAARLRAMVELARADERLAARRADFDADPMLLNCSNGVVDLRTGALRDHDPELLLSHYAPVAYDPDAGSGAFEQFVLDCVGGDETYLDWLRRAVGYSLTGRTDEEALFVLHGPGGTGKSTLLAALEGVWGTYARSADVSVFVHQQAGRPRNDVARLRDARLVCVTEVDERAELAAALLKRLTGGDTVAARFLFAEEFEFRPQLKLWMASNHLPAIDSRDSGMFRRLRIVPFEHAPKVARPQLKRDLTDVHLRGAEILAWAISGAIDWHRRPLSVDVPDAVQQATGDYAERSDPISAWMERMVVADHDSFTASRELYRHFRTHTVRGARPVSETEFVRHLKAVGMPFTRRKDCNGFRVQLAA